MKQKIKQKITSSHVLGSLIGINLVYFFWMQVSLFLQYLEVSGRTVSKKQVYMVMAVSSLLLFAVIFRWFTKKKGGLVRYFFAAIIFSVWAVVGVVLSIARLAYYLASYTDFFTEINTPEKDLIISIAGSFFLFFLAAIFALCFSTILKPKITYLKYISEKVEEMKADGVGTIMEVKGEDELAQLSREINRMSITLKEKQEHERQEEESKNRFIADISHDLRTPLTSIMGYVDLIKENGFESKEKFEQYMEVVDRRLKNLKSMIDQLFEYTKLNQKDFSLVKEKTDLMPLISYMDFEYGSIFKKLGFRWRVNTEKLCLEKGGLFVNIESQAFLRAIGNLLENAKKYSTKHSEIIMEVTTKGDRVSLSLSNETQEITEQDIAQIFERFYKGDKSRGSGDSTGLGLPIVKKIIELEEGEIYAAWDQGRVKFTITLPLVFFP